MSRGKNRKKGREKNFEANLQVRPSRGSQPHPSSSRKKRSAKAVATDGAKPQRSRTQTPAAVGSSRFQSVVPFSRLQDSAFSRPGDNDDHMTPINLGNNRLRSGFVNSNTQQSAATSLAGAPATRTVQPDVHDLTTTDDDQDDDGGITLNLQDNEHNSIIVISDDEDLAEEGHALQEMALDAESSLEEGEEREVWTPHHNGNASTQQPAQETEVSSFVLDTTPSLPQKKLADLNPGQLKSQLMYAFWQFDRDQIDLGRLVRCLHCQGEGHLADACPQRTCIHCQAAAEHESDQCPSVRRCATCREPGHRTCAGIRNTTIPCDICSLAGHTESACSLRHYPRSIQTPPAPLRLWISCCVCASKSHLAGDCPLRTSLAGLRWSLRDITQVINLSVQTGIGKMETAAQSKNMRPQGLKIRGKGNNFRSNPPPRDDSESDELSNLSRPARRAKHDFSGSSVPSTIQPDGVARYDRFAAPTSKGPYVPPRNGFYSTDSFGRPRSRSPASTDSYRPNRRRSPPRESARSLESRITGNGAISINLPSKPSGRANLSHSVSRKTRKKR